MLAHAPSAILVTQDLSFPAGAMLYARHMLENLWEQGWRLAVWTDRKPQQDDDLWAKADWHECPEFFRDGHGIGGRFRRIGAESALLRLVKSHRPTHCLIVCDVPHAVYRRLSRWSNVVFFLHGVTHTCPQDTGLRYLPKSQTICRHAAGLGCLETDKTEGCLGSRSLWRKVQRIWTVRSGLRSLGKLDSVIANSEYVAELYEQNQRDIRIRVLEPCVTPCHGVPYSDRDDNARYNLLYIGRIEAHKGAIEAIEILSLLPPGYRLTLIGSGNEIEQVRRRSEQLGVAARVEIVGWLGRERLSQRLRLGGLLLMPALCAEAFGMSGPEALCAGIPVVAYDVGGVASWCNRAAAQRVPVGKRAAAADAIVNMTSDAACWRGLCLAAYRYGQERFATGAWRSRLNVLLRDNGNSAC
jgi:glycosyltransferase involved in cell wall biosynthesis